MSGNLAEMRREELIGGEIVMMAPAYAGHAITSNNIYRIFGNYLQGKPCIAFNDNLMVYLTDTDHFIPDVMVVCDRGKIKEDGVHGAPDIVVEVLSPSTAKNDRGKKKDAYERSGVPEYWIVDTKKKSIEVYLLRGGHYDLDHIYTLYSTVEWENLMDGDRAAAVTEFRCHLYDDLLIRLDDIFVDLF